MKQMKVVAQSTQPFQEKHEKILNDLAKLPTPKTTMSEWLDELGKTKTGGKKKSKKTKVQTNKKQDGLK